MKKSLCVILLLLFVGCKSQDQRTDEMYKINIAMIGDSITEGAGDWNQIFNMADRAHFINLGVSGNKTVDVLKRLQNIILAKPDVVFVMLGINDLNIPRNPNEIIPNIITIVEEIQSNLPGVKIYLQSVLPINTADFDEINRINIDHIIELNILIYKYAIENRLNFIDLYSLFANKAGYLNKQYSYDGIHLNESGYKYWGSLLKSHIINELVVINK